MKVFCYRNLHKKGVIYSVKNTKTNKVIDWVENIVLKDVELKVSQAGRNRVLKEKRKNVHAGVKGTIFTIPLSEDLKWEKAYYNPYKYNSFVDSELEPIYVVKYAKLQHDGLWIIR